MRLRTLPEPENEKSARKREVLALLKEIRAGDGIEWSPAEWRSSMAAMVLAATRRGAARAQAERLGRAFLERAPAAAPACRASRP